MTERHFPQMTGKRSETSDSCVSVTLVWWENLHGKGWGEKEREMITKQLCNYHIGKAMHQWETCFRTSTSLAWPPKSAFTYADRNLEKSYFQPSDFNLHEQKWELNLSLKLKKKKKQPNNKPTKQTNSEDEKIKCNIEKQSALNLVLYPGGGSFHTAEALFSFLGKCGQDFQSLVYIIFSAWASISLLPAYPVQLTKQETINLCQVFLVCDK